MYWKTFEDDPGPWTILCGDWEDGEGGIVCYRTPLDALLEGGPVLAQVEASGLKRGWTGNYITAEEITPIRIFRWTVEDSCSLAQFVADFVLDKISKLTKEDVNILKNYNELYDGDIENISSRFENSFPLHLQEDASYLRLLLYRYQDVLCDKNNDEIQLQQWAAEAALAAIRVLNVIDRQGGGIMDWVVSQFFKKSSPPKV